MAESNEEQVVVEEKPVEQSAEKPVEENLPEKTPEQIAAEKVEAEKKKENHSTRRMTEFMRRAFKAEAEAEVYKNMLEKKGSPSEQPVRPTREQFNTDDEFVEAITDFKLAQVLPKIEAKLQARVNQVQSSAGWEQNVGTFQKEHADFFEVLKQADDIPVPDAITSAITTSANGPAIMYDLCKNPDELSRIANLPPMAAAREIGIIEARLTGARKQVSSAKPPIKPVNGGSSVVDVPEDKLSDREWMAKFGHKARMKQQTT
jgi:hypothetical protein